MSLFIFEFTYLDGERPYAKGEIFRMKLHANRLNLLLISIFLKKTITPQSTVCAFKREIHLFVWRIIANILVYYYSILYYLKQNLKKHDRVQNFDHKRIDLDAMWLLLFFICTMHMHIRFVFIFIFRMCL